MSPIELFVVAALIALSAFMSGSEIALFSLSRFQLRGLREHSAASYRKIRRLLNDPAGLLIAVLVINEGLNIALSTLITRAVEDHGGAVFLNRLSWLPHWGASSLAGILITAPILLLFCEVTPKVLAARANQLIAPLSVGPLTWSYDLLKPVRQVLVRLVRWIANVLGDPARALSQGEGGSKLKEEEFLVMIEEGHREGAIQETEMELIRNVFDLDDTQALDIATPISRVVSIVETTRLSAAHAALKSHRFSRIPILKAGHRRQVVGILYRKDLLLSTLDPIDPGATVESLMHKPFAVNRELRLNTLFRRLKQQRTHIAVVEDDHGSALGIVTMTDVLDALFEDILDPDEVEAKL